MQPFTYTSEQLAQLSRNMGAAPVRTALPPAAPVRVSSWPGVVGAIGAPLAAGALGYDIDQEDVAPIVGIGYGAGRGVQAAAANPMVRSALGMAANTAGQFASKAPRAGVFAPAIQEVASLVQTGDFTPTEQLAKELGVAVPASVGGDLAVRTLGMGNRALFNIPGYLAKKVFDSSYDGPADPMADARARYAARNSPAPAVAAAPAETPPAPTAIPSGPMEGLGGSPYVPTQQFVETQRQPALPPPAAPSFTPALRSAPPPTAAPALAAQPAYPTFTESPELKEARQRAAQSADKIDALFEQISQANKTPVPKGLSATDKWSLLAGALGTAAMVSAFPEYGLLAGLGAGAVVGSGGYNAIQQRNANQAEAERQRQLDTIKQQGALYKDQYDRRRGDVRDLAESERGVFRDQLGAFKDQRDFAQREREFAANEAFRNRPPQVAPRQYGTQLVQMPNGQYQVVEMRPGATFQGQPVAAGGARGGASYRPYVPKADTLFEQIDAAKARLLEIDKRYAANPIALQRDAENSVRSTLGAFGYGVQGAMGVEDDVAAGLAQ